MVNYADNSDGNRFFCVMEIFISVYGEEIIGYDVRDDSFGVPALFVSSCVCFGEVR